MGCGDNTFVIDESVASAVVTDPNECESLFSEACVLADSYVCMVQDEDTGRYQICVSTNGSDLDSILVLDGRKEAFELVTQIQKVAARAMIDGYEAGFNMAKETVEGSLDSLKKELKRS